MYLEGCDVIPLEGRYRDLGHGAAHGGRRAHTKEPKASAEVRVGGEGQEHLSQRHPLLSLHVVSHSIALLHLQKQTVEVVVTR